jgi:hypothetical protein
MQGTRGKARHLLPGLSDLPPTVWRGRKSTGLVEKARPLLIRTVAEVMEK